MRAKCAVSGLSSLPTFGSGRAPTKSRVSLKRKEACHPRGARSQPLRIWAVSNKRTVTFTFRFGTPRQHNLTLPESAGFSVAEEAALTLAGPSIKSVPQETNGFDCRRSRLLRLLLTADSC